MFVYQSDVTLGKIITSFPSLKYIFDRNIYICLQKKYKMVFLVKMVNVTVYC